MKSILGLCILCLLLSAAPAAAAANCEGWNTAAFFKSATLKAVTDCLQAGAEVNARNEYGETPLHRAAGNSKTPAVVKALLDAGAKVNARDKDGRTPLHGATLFSITPAVVDLLLDAGADPAAKNKEGKTPYDYAKANAALKGTLLYSRLNVLHFLEKLKPQIVEQWECFDYWQYRDRAKGPVLAKLKRLKIGDHEFGEIEVSGSIQEAEFKVEGFDRRWDFGNRYKFAFIIRPKRTGLYYDFNSESRVKPSQMFRCEK